MNALQAELAEARINLATIRAFPKHNPAIQAGAALADPAPELLDGLTEGEKGKFLSLLAAMREEAAAAAAEARADFETQELRARLGRAPSTMNLPPEKMERLVAVLREGSDEIRSFRGAPGAAQDETALRKRVEEIGRETRARLMDFLSPEEIDAVDAVLSPPAPPGNGDR